MLTDHGTVTASTWCPRAADGLTWSAMDGAFVVSRAGDPTVHVVNHTGMLLLELANGQHSLNEMTDILATAFRLGRPPEAAVRQFLDRALCAGLVE